MAPPPSPPPPAEYPNPPAPTTIAALTDDLLREIFLRLPDLPSLVCAAFTCRAFVGAVRSSPAFRRRLRTHHAPPLLALFLNPYLRVVPACTTAWRPSDPGFPATQLQDGDDTSVWAVRFDGPSILQVDGYFVLDNRSTKQPAFYNPQTKSLYLWPKGGETDNIPGGTFLEFHTLFAEEDQGPSRVVCVCHDDSWTWVRVAVFSSNTMEWQISPEAATLLSEGKKYTTRTVVDRFVCWDHKGEGYISLLNTATFQLSRVDLPPDLKGFKIGQTKDGKLRIVKVEDCTLFAWIWTTDHDGVERFMLRKMFPLQTAFKDITKCSAQENIRVRIMAIIDGFVYLYVEDIDDWPICSHWGIQNLKLVETVEKMVVLQAQK